MNISAEYDLAIIGAGPGGYAAAFRAADLGKKVALIDKNQQLGGVCLNRGCIPSKTLLHLAKVIEDAKSLKKAGVVFDQAKLNINEIQQWKNSIVDKLSKGITQLAKLRNVNIINGIAKFESINTLSINCNNKIEYIKFNDCIIASGSRPSTINDIKIDHINIINSTDALNFTSIPKELLIIGGGYIGLEMGSVYSALGSNVTIAEFMPHLLPGADQDLVKPLARKLNKIFKNIYLSSKVIAVKNNKNKKLDVTINKKNNSSDIIEVYDKVLLSIGRKPNTDNLGLEQLGITLSKDGFIPVNIKRQTTLSNIYAIGDITGNPMLAHKATHEGKVAAEVISGHKSSFEPAVIPAVIFTDPEIAWAGPTELELQQQNIQYEKSEFPWKASGKAMSLNALEGKTKLIFDPDSKKLISVGIVGPNAGDLIGEAVLAIEMGCDAMDIGLSIHPHPTLNETIANAAEIFSGTITDLYLPKS